MNYEKLINHLKSLSIADELPVLELLTCIKEDGLIPFLAHTEGIDLTDAQAEELLVCLRQKGYESTLSESICTGVPFETCGEKYRPGPQCEIRHAMTCLELDDHALPSGFRRLAEWQFRKADYRKQYT